MKDYSKVYPSQEEMLLKSGKIIFDIQRNNGSEKQLVTIDNYDGNLITVKAVIQTHTNPLNENKEDRQLLVPSGTVIHTGSAIEFLNEQWMVISNVGLDDDNGTYIKCKIYPINNKLKYLLPSNNSVYEISCISSNMSLYSEGLYENKYFVTEDNKKFVTVPYNAKTKEIFIGQRFYFWDKKVFKVTEIFSDKAKSTGYEGILEIKMTQDDILPKDNNVNTVNDGLAVQTTIIPSTGSDDW